MNQCEKVMLDKMVETRRAMRLAEMGAPQLDRDRCISEITLLLDCIIEWRYPTTETLESGCGAMVKKED